jgi:hypothetical protein|tara:strand:+ start:588 stop:920 length:333 start_codon:yes stop_codon:yes gene_type:complete
MKKVKLPDAIDVSYHHIKIELISSHLSQEVGEQQGCYVARDMIIYLDKDLIEAGGTRACSLLLHEVGHAIFYIFNLAAAEEERAVDSFANGYTEVLTRNPQLKKWINQNT